MLYLFFVDSCKGERQGSQAYQELIHMPMRFLKSIINHIGSDWEQGTLETQMTLYLPSARNFAIILGFAQS
jgi:hypothetical protein